MMSTKRRKQTKDKRAPEQVVTTEALEEGLKETRPVAVELRGYEIPVSETYLADRQGAEGTIELSLDIRDLHYSDGELKGFLEMVEVIDAPEDITLEELRPIRARVSKLFYDHPETFRKQALKQHLKEV